MNRFWKKSHPLNRVIDEEVDYHRLDVKKIKHGQSEQFQLANDEFLVKDERGALAYFILFFSIAFLLTSFFFIFCLIMDKDKFDFSAFFMPAPFWVLAIIQLILYFKKTKKELIFDRLNGKITYPRGWFKKEHVTIPFDSLGVFHRFTSSGDSIVNGVEIRIMDNNRGSVLLATTNPREYWSFMVWYMDKNRPLPPGTAFDAYRYRDFERRKAEGFPKPLYPSYIATPEATPAQQRERKKIGKW